MAIFQYRLHSPRSVFVSEANGLARKVWFEAVLTSDDLSVKDAGTIEYPSEAIVTFVESADLNGNGALEYLEKWYDEGSGKTSSGSCRLVLPVDARLLGFLDSYERRGNELHLAIEVAADRAAMFYMGDPVGEGEYSWDPSVRNPLPASIHSIGYVPAKTTPSGGASNPI